MALVLFTLKLSAAGLAVLLFVLIFVLRVGSRPKDYPPGPPTLPLLGNLHLVSILNLSRRLRMLTGRQMPSKDSHLQFQKWAEEYGFVDLLPTCETYLVTR